MNYMLTPLERHFDLGFGAMGNSFKQGADAIAALELGSTFLNSHLPLSFMYRHSMELFLKSSIIIVHKVLKLPYGTAPFDGEPQVLVGKKWRAMFEVHALSALNNYRQVLFDSHKVALGQKSHMDWDIGQEFGEWIKAIEATDSSSTFFRYPVTRHQSLDKNKSVMKSDDYLNIFARMGPGQPNQKAFIVLDQNEKVTEAYRHDDSSSKEIITVLRQAADKLYSLHAALRGELTGGR